VGHAAVGKLLEVVLPDVQSARGATSVRGAKHGLRAGDSCEIALSHRWHTIVTAKPEESYYLEQRRTFWIANLNMRLFFVLAT